MMNATKEKVFCVVCWYKKKKQTKKKDKKAGKKGLE